MAVKNFGALGTVLLGIAITIVAAVAGAKLVASLIDDWAGSSNSIAENYTNADWGDETANSLNSVFAMLIALGFAFGMIGLIFAVIALRRSSAG